MSSNTQYNTDRTSAQAGNTGLRGTEREYVTTTERIVHDSQASPSTQQQYGQGTTTSTTQSSRLGEEGDLGQMQYGRGQGGIGTGVGHHRSHQEGGTYLGQDTSGGGDMKTTSLRPAEQTTQTYTSGVAGDPSAGTTTMGYGTGTQTGHVGDPTGRYAGDTTTGTTGTGNQYSSTGYHGLEGHHHKHHHLGGDQSQEVTGTSAKPKVTDKIIGGAEKVAGKMTSNTEMYQRGEERVAGETARKNA